MYWKNNSLPLKRNSTALEKKTKNPSRSCHETDNAWKYSAGISKSLFNVSFYMSLSHSLFCKGSHSILYWEKGRCPCYHHRPYTINYSFLEDPLIEEGRNTISRIIWDCIELKLHSYLLCATQLTNVVGLSLQAELRLGI